MNIKDMPMFLAMRDIFYGGEFSRWIDSQSMPMAAWKEYEEAFTYFCEQSGFRPPDNE